MDHALLGYSDAAVGGPISGHAHPRPSSSCVSESAQGLLFIALARPHMWRECHVMEAGNDACNTCCGGLCPAGRRHQRECPTSPGTRVETVNHLQGSGHLPGSAPLTGSTPRALAAERDRHAETDAATPAGDEAAGGQLGRDRWGNWWPAGTTVGQRPPTAFQNPGSTSAEWDSSHAHGWTICGCLPTNSASSLGEKSGNQPALGAPRTYIP